jgi:hypothetical protein
MAPKRRPRIANTKAPSSPFESTANSPTGEATITLLPFDIPPSDLLESSLPSEIESNLPSQIESSLPSEIESNLPSEIESNLPSEIESKHLSRLIWSEEMQEALVEYLYATFKSGRSSDNSFKKGDFAIAATKVSRVHTGPAPVTPDHCKNKWGDLKAKWKHWLKLSEMSGFGWDEDTQLYKADDYVWDRLNRSEPGILWHKTHILYWRDLLSEILHEAQATGRGAVSGVRSGPIDPRLIAASSNRSSPSPPPYNKSKRRAKADLSDDDDSGKTARKRGAIKVDLGVAISGLTEEIRSARKAKEEFKTDHEKAVQLFESEYKGRLDMLAFIQGLTFLKDIGNAVTFLALKDKATRDRWLEIELQTEIF